MTGLARIQSAISFEPVDRVPVAPMLGAHAVALAGIAHERACSDAAAQADALLCAVETYEPDAVFTLMDLSAEPEAFGAEVAIAGARHPVVVRHLSREQVTTQRLEECILTARVPVFVETVARLKQALGDSICIGALISGPLTAASNALGLEQLSRLLRRDRDFVSHLLERLTAACLALQLRHAEAGAHAVVLLEPVATSAILGPPDLEHLLLPHLQRLSAAAREQGLISALHVCGDCSVSLPLFAQSGVHVLSLDSAVSLPSAQRVLGQNMAVMGNVDVRRLLPSGSPDEVTRAGRSLLAEFDRSFILSTGCEAPAGTPQKNMQALVRAARP
ncbi:MAG: hypothetical protein JXA57_04875 [Armatimonadetes bacterium]|nr:hypothetical protein [Armatimonadota bacterium]